MIKSGKDLILLRQFLRVTQKAFGKPILTSRVSVSEWENSSGKLSFKRVAKIKQAAHNILQSYLADKNRKALHPTYKRILECIRRDEDISDFLRHGFQPIELRLKSLEPAVKSQALERNLEKSCPWCNAQLTIDGISDRELFFCGHCNQKIVFAETKLFKVSE